MDIDAKETADRRLEIITTCPICQGDGQELYQELSDRLALRHAQQWEFRQCRRCRHAWLTYRYKLQHIDLAYKNYSELHWPEERPFSRASWKLFLKDAYFAGAFNYSDGVPFWKARLGWMLSLAPNYDQKLARQVRFLPAKNDGRLLDVGSGNGWFLQNMQRLGWQVEGVDTDPMSVEKARKRGVPVRAGTLEEQSYPDELFDAVTLSHVIEHMHHPRQALTECFRILKPGGKLVVFTPNLESLGHRLFKSAWLNLDPPRHLHLFTFHSIEITVKQAGFHLDKLTSTGYRAVGTWLKSKSIEEHGYYQPDDRARTLRRKLPAYLFYLYQNISLLWNRKAGEEIVLIARKPLRSPV